MERFRFEFTFYSLSGAVGFIAKSSDGDAIRDFYSDLAMPFTTIDEQGEKTIHCLQPASPTLISEILKAIEKYYDLFPQLKALPSYFDKIKEGDHFYYLPNVKITASLRMQAYLYLECLRAGLDPEEQREKFNAVYGPLLDKYELATFGAFKAFIGSYEKEDRSCRFCGRGQGEVSFDRVAHAMSEALGNKNVILFDECDDCNQKFGNTIEPDLIQYYGLFRTVYQVKGKPKKKQGSTKSYKGLNFELSNKEGIELKIKSNEGTGLSRELPITIPLNGNRKLTDQNIYKALCKYFLSVVDSDELPNFKATADWVNGTVKASELPKIAERITYEGFCMEPRLSIYVQKNPNDTSLPYAVASFQLTCFQMVYIIPFCGKDDRDFMDKSDYGNFWSLFKHYSQSDKWGFNFHSSDVPKDLIQTLSFTLPQDRIDN